MLKTKKVTTISFKCSPEIKASLVKISKSEDRSQSYMLRKMLNEAITQWTKK